MSIHHQTHPEPLDDCIVCKAVTVSVNRAAVTKIEDGREARLSKDLAAYKRLRRDGLHPKQIDGSANLEGKVDSQFDIDLGRVIPKSEQSRVEEGFGLVQDMNLGNWPRK